METQTLTGRTIAVPETRELDLFAALLERRGAQVLRCPLVAIRDAPDPQPVLAFIRRFAAGLRKAGLQPGDRVLLFSGNSLFCPIVLLGIVMAGGIFTGANPGFVAR